MWTIAINELRRLLQARSVLFLLVVAPLTLIFILGSALANVFNPKDQKIEAVKLAYYDEDKGRLSQGFESYLQAMKGEGRLTAAEANSREDVLRKIKSGEAQFGLYIPKGFSDSVLQGKEGSWELINGGDRIKNRVGRMIMQSFVDETNRMQSAAIVLGPKAAEPSAGSSKAVPEPVYVETGKLAKDGKEYSALQYYSSTMLVMFLLFSGLTAALGLLKEKEAHTLLRLQSMPVSPTRIIAGKLSGNSLLAAIQASAIIAVTAFAFGADWGGSPFYLALICLTTIAASMGMAFIVAFLFRSTKTASAVFASFIGLMTFASGGMMPTDGTPLEYVKPFTVNYWASNSFIRLMTGQTGSAVIGNLAVLAAMACAFMLIAFTLYRKEGYHE